MAVQSRTTLKGYFNTNDRPTETQFSDLIDSFVSMNDADESPDVDGAKRFSGSVLVSNSVLITGSALVSDSVSITGSVLITGSFLSVCSAGPSGLRIETCANNGLDHAIELRSGSVEHGMTDWLATNGYSYISNNNASGGQE